MSYTRYKAHTRLVLATLTIATVLSVGPVPAQAQTRAPRREASPDTGRMRPAHVEWARYDGPAMCLAASRNVQHLTDRRELIPYMDERAVGYLLDTLAYTPALDTLSVAARAAAKVCLARFSVDRVPARELTPFLQAALRAGEDSLARAAMDRQLALVASAGPRAQAEVLRAAIFSLLDAHPPRMETARALLARLDTLGAVAQLPRLAAHMSLFFYYAREAIDVDAAKRELETVRALARGRTPADLAEGASGGIGSNTPMVVALLNLDDPRVVTPYVTEWIADLEHEHPEPGLAQWTRQWFQGYTQAIVTPLGKPVPPVRVDYVFSPGGAVLPAGAPVPAPTEVRVRPGRVTFWLVAPEDWRENLPAIRHFVAGVRQMRARYGDSVDIVVFTRTRGYTPGSLVQQPPEEAEAIRKHFLELRHLPATLAVSVAPVRTLPDSTRLRGPVPYDELFKAYGDPSTWTQLPVRFVVAGRDGTFAQRFLLDRPNSALYRILDQVVGTSGGGAPTR